MDNNQINHHNMLIKVIDFLDDHSAETATVAEVADCEADLNDLFTKIVEADGEAIEDTGGTTDDKAEARDKMIALTLKCCNGAKAFGTASGNRQLVRKVTITKSRLDKERDDQLHTTCRRAYKTVQPLTASLAGYQVSATDVSDWDTAIENFLDLSPEPGDRKDDRVVAGHKVDLYQAEVTGILTKRLDVYMDTFLPSAPFLVEEYYLARAIDDLGGSPGAWVHTNTVPAASGVDTPTFTAGPTKPIKIENTGAVDLSFQLADSGGAIGSPVSVAATASFTGTVGGIGTGGDRFKVTNADLTTAGSFKITIG